MICKSLLGKAHTVMAEGGIAAAMGNVYPEDNWQVHFRDTMRGGKLLNHWRMAELHAKEAPERVWELEQWGALFDRTPEGLISQRDFGGHRYARLAHVGDRTGLEMIRTLQQRTVSLGVDVFMECTVTDLLKDGGRISGAFGYWEIPGGSSVRCPGNRAGHGWHRQVLEGHVQLLGVHRRWPRPGPAGRRRPGQHGVRPVPPHGHGVAPLSPGNPGHGVGERRRGHSQELGRRALHVQLHPGVLQGGDGRQHRGGRPLVHRQAQQPPAPGAPAPRRGGPRHQLRDQGGAGIAPRGGLPRHRDPSYPEFIQKRLPSMYHQFKELAEVDITKEAMEIGPTCHYVMGGVEVDPDSAWSRVPGLYAAGEVAGGMHGANRLGGNSLSDLLVFGKRAGGYAAEYAAGGAGAAGPRSPRRTWTRRREALCPVQLRGRREPLHRASGAAGRMQDLVGIIRTEASWSRPSTRSPSSERESPRSRGGPPQYNPGWHLAVDLRQHAAGLEASPGRPRAQGEPRRSHPRRLPDDRLRFWGKLNLIVDLDARATARRSPPGAAGAPGRAGGPPRGAH